MLSVVPELLLNKLGPYANRLQNPRDTTKREEHSYNLVNSVYPAKRNGKYMELWTEALQSHLETEQEIMIENGCPIPYI
jgi:hypothetical protein